MPEPSPASQGRNWALGALVFFGGFAVMVLEIVGARDMQPIFGGDLYVWASQIGVVMMALAMGYAIGGRLADRLRHARFLAAFLIPAAVFIFAIPIFAPKVLQSMVDPTDVPVRPMRGTSWLPNVEILNWFQSDSLGSGVCVSA